MFKTSRQHRRRNHEQAGNNQGPESGTLSVDERPQSDDCEDATDHETKASNLFRIGGDVNDSLTNPRKILFSNHLSRLMASDHPRASRSFLRPTYESRSA